MKKWMSVFLTAAAICFASTSSIAGKTSQPPQDNPSKADRAVTIAGMGTTTEKIYALERRRCTSLSGAEKANCLAYARQRHGEI